ncbi:hypothetical protein BS47DRAFT_1367450 [Hydnum rufescens UP504]|uniref:Uncharacterized protein n=1 Tax=Hydnum rufescens UP504 TaxID=1448309 RepID=A0A9P6AI90_9AGAM|nr:hypothetical protein BS47DRAFT_1367450 [Hydnum rufescens UP504]
MNAPPNPAKQKTNANQTPTTVSSQMKPCQNDNIPMNDDVPNTETNHAHTVAGVWFYTRSSFPPNEYVPETPPIHLRTVQKTSSQRYATLDNNEYHTPTNAGVWYYKDPKMKTTDSHNPQTTHTTVNRQAMPAQMATNEPGEPPSKPQGSNAQYHIPPSVGVWYKSGAKRAVIAALFVLL